METNKPVLTIFVLVAFIAIVLLVLYGSAQITGESIKFKPVCVKAPCLGGSNLDTSVNKDLTCGGISGKKCPADYTCKKSFYPDASGTCVKEVTPKEKEDNAREAFNKRATDCKAKGWKWNVQRCQYCGNCVKPSKPV